MDIYREKMRKLRLYAHAKGKVFAWSKEEAERIIGGRVLGVVPGNYVGGAIESIGDYMFWLKVFSKCSRSANDGEAAFGIDLSTVEITKEVSDSVCECIGAANQLGFGRSIDEKSGVIVIGALGEEVMTAIKEVRDGEDN